MLFRTFSPASIAATLVQFATGALELLLGLRFILKLFSANPQTPFVDWIYTNSISFLSPFQDIFPTIALDKNFVVEFTTLFAVIIYATAGYLVSHFLIVIEQHFEDLINRPKKTSTEQQYRQ